MHGLKATLKDNPVNLRETQQFRDSPSLENFEQLMAGAAIAWKLLELRLPSDFWWSRGVKCVRFVDGAYV